MSWSPWGSQWTSKCRRGGEPTRKRGARRASRYETETAALQFEVDWRAGEPGPTSGVLNFSGALVEAPDLSDTIQVASVDF